MQKNKSLHKFLFNIYAFAFCDKLLFLMPVYAIFMQSHGVSDMMLAVLIMLLSLGTVVTQIPVTWITNSIGARRTIIMGQMLKALGVTMWIIWPNLWGFAIGMLLWGVQWATFAVAFEGMMYDEMDARGQRAEYTRALGRRNVIQAVAIAMSSLGSLLMIAGYGWVTLASVMMCALSCIFIARIDLRAKHAPVQKTQFREMFRTGVQVYGKKPCVFIMMMLSLLVANIAYLDDYLGPIGLQIGLRVEYVGFVSLVLLGCSAAGQIIAPRLKQTPDWILYTAIAVAGGMYVVFSNIYSVSGLWTLGVGYMMFGAINILLYSRFQDLIPQRYRSVMLAMHSIGTHIVYIGTCLIIGLGGTIGSWRYSIWILGIILCGIGISALTLVRNKCAIEKK